MKLHPQSAFRSIEGIRHMAGTFTRRVLRIDRRCRFRDMRRIAPAHRFARSKILQFYSSHPNIGNYLPVLGMQQMLGTPLDTWCIHDRLVDFDWINKNYKGVIVGGAGLLHRCFEQFWRRLGKECKVPIVIWGVGGCYPDDEGESGVTRDAVDDVTSRCDLINVRDQMTAERYGWRSAHIAACPTVAYLSQYLGSAGCGERLLFASHDELVKQEETLAIMEKVAAADGRFILTDNVQTWRFGLTDIIVRQYLKSRLAVTTRLHGAIIAYSLGIPYVAVPRDAKLREFHRLFGNGVLLENISDLSQELTAVRPTNLRPALEPVHEFGKLASAWGAALGN